MVKEQKKVSEFKNLDCFVDDIDENKVVDENKKLKVIEKNIDKYLIKLRKRIVKETKLKNKNLCKPTQMIIDEKKKRTNVTIFEECFSIGNSNGEYRVSAKEAPLQGIVTNPNIKVLNGTSFVYVEKHEYLYCIVTNIKVDFNENISYLSTDSGISSFSIDNLYSIDIEDNCLYVKNDLDAEEIKDNNTLLISQEEGKVYLPYKVEDLVEELKQYPNITLKQLIQVKYIQPIERYNFSIKARYCEAYELMHEKEKKSVSASIMLGLELMFEFNLHPAIIHACKNLEQLDIYLDCLEDNELEKFNCFKIEYKALPTLAKLKKIKKLQSKVNSGQEV